MGKKCLGIFLLFLMLLAACRSDTGPPSESVKWYGYNDGIQIGEKEGKKIFITFYADWCTFCTKMEKETFHNREVVSFLNKRFISIRVNKDKEDAVARKHFVTGLPMTWFMESDGEKINSLPGYIPPEMFLQILKYIDSESYKDMTFKEYVDSV